jgi:hypothetical protein
MLYFGIKKVHSTSELFVRMDLLSISEEKGGESLGNMRKYNGNCQG